MNTDERVKCIVDGMELYFRTFALADNVCLHAEDIEWIAPKPGANGPAIVYRVTLEEQTAYARLESLLPEIKAGMIPAFWVISPTSTPSNIVDCLVSMGFQNLPNGESPEPGMALEIEAFLPGARANLNTQVKKVTSVDEFAVWIDIVNGALHGWELLSVKHYVAWLSHKPLSFYLGYRNGTPIATLATIQDGKTASIEFVSTLEAYRRQGAATALCVKAIKELQSAGAKIVTLRSHTEAIPLYAGLGFTPYYEQILLSYPR